MYRFSIDRFANRCVSMPKHRNDDRLLMIDLFAGCGGLSLGFENAGFHSVYVNELNDDARSTYLRNRLIANPSLSKFSSADIKQAILSDSFFDDLKSGLAANHRLGAKDTVDVITGGPPCQGYSGIGIRRSYAVDKVQLPSNHLYQDMAYFIFRMRPKAFVFENVEGLLRARWTKSGEKGEIFSDVLNTFKGIDGYEVRWRLVHAGDYGVPQNRPRVVIVGFRTDVFGSKSDSADAIEAGFLPAPIGRYADIVDALDDIVDKNFKYGGSTDIYPRNATTEMQEYFRRLQNGDIARRGAPITEHEYSNHSQKVREKFAYMIAHNGAIPKRFATKKFAQRVLPKRWGNSKPSITVCSLPDDFVHYEQARSLTVREWARLQTFPDWYQFSGKRTTGGLRRAGNPQEQIFDREVPKYTQIGNAVPVLLAQAIGEHIGNVIRASRK